MMETDPFIFYIFGNRLLNCEEALLCKGMPKNCDEILVELGEDMGASGDRIEPKKIEDHITKHKAMWVYLKEGVLLLFIEGIEGYSEQVSL
jgi:hypothetical protein